MFERYTEKARRVVFFARYEASQFGSPYIESEHLLLGLLREDKGLSQRYFESFKSVGEIRRQIEAHTSIGERTSTSVDLPVSNECKRILAYAAEEAERAGHQHIGTEHLLAGILREHDCFAAEILRAHGIKLEELRESLSNAPGHEISGGTGIGGGGGGSFHLRPARLIFVEGTERIAVAPAAGWQSIPHIGEEIVLDSDKEPRHAFRVVHVKHIYEHYLADVPKAPCRLKAIVIQVERLSEETPPGASDIPPE